MLFTFMLLTFIGFQMIGRIWNRNLLKGRPNFLPIPCDRRKSGQQFHIWTVNFSNTKDGHQSAKNHHSNRAKASAGSSRRQHTVEADEGN